MSPLQISLAFVTSIYESHFLEKRSIMSSHLNLLELTSEIHPLSPLTHQILETRQALACSPHTQEEPPFQCFHVVLVCACAKGVIRYDLAHPSSYSVTS